jgi:hypothetical protein
LSTRRSIEFAVTSFLLGRLGEVLRGRSGTSFCSCAFNILLKDIILSFFGYLYVCSNVSLAFVVVSTWFVVVWILPSCRQFSRKVQERNQRFLVQ